ncbi:MAG TPA: BlaI/MecI/CopY family transcriptional regulator [Chloroflexota bacterium]|nr:BlaI/MecI/CopY family transcriptional regulator [Chloroflexota bacterium]
MKGKKPGLGAQQWEVLRWVSEQAPVTVAQAAEAFAQSHGLARTTVLTVMERLREKGHLTRQKRGTTYEYSPAVPKAQLLREQVAQFVEGTLGGSFGPFLAYLAQETEVSGEQLHELKRLVRELEAGQTPTPQERDTRAGGGRS